MPSSTPARRAQPLRGLTVFVARPVGQARTITRRIDALGAKSFALPTASLRGSDDPERARRALARIANAAAAVFVSPAAVRFAFRLVPKLASLFRRGQRCIAVGPSTQRALARRGVQAVTPMRFDSEGVLALPALSDVRGKCVVIVAAPGGRDTMRRELESRGAKVELAHVYRRALPRWSASHHRAIETSSAKSVLIVSSADSLAVLAQLGGDDFVRRFAHRRLVVPSERIEHAARAIGFDRIVRASSALPVDLVAALARSFD